MANRLKPYSPLIVILCAVAFLFFMAWGFYVQRGLVKAVGALIGAGLLIAWGVQEFREIRAEQAALARPPFTTTAAGSGFPEQPKRGIR